jgi:hypothetical protein
MLNGRSNVANGEFGMDLEEEKFKRKYYVRNTHLAALKENRFLTTVSAVIF